MKTAGSWFGKAPCSFKTNRTMIGTNTFSWAFPNLVFQDTRNPTPQARQLLFFCFLTKPFGGSASGQASLSTTAAPGQNRPTAAPKDPLLRELNLGSCADGRSAASKVVEDHEESKRRLDPVDSLSLSIYSGFVCLISLISMFQSISNKFRPFLLANSQ